MRTQTTRAVGGRVSSDGTIVQPGPFTVRRVGAGDYTLTFSDRALAVSPTVAPQSGNVYVAIVLALGPNTYRVLTYTAQNVLSDQHWAFTAVVAA